MSIAIFAVAPFMFLFPEKQEGSWMRKEAIAKGELKGADDAITINASGLWKSTKSLIKNKCYIFAVLGVTTTTVVGAGLGSSFPKFLILKFGASTDVAAIASGCAIMPSMFREYHSCSFNFPFEFAIWNWGWIRKKSALSVLAIFLRPSAPFEFQSYINFGS